MISLIPIKAAASENGYWSMQATTQASLPTDVSVLDKASSIIGYLPWLLASGGGIRSMSWIVLIAGPSNPPKG